MPRVGAGGRGPGPCRARDRGGRYDTARPDHPHDRQRVRVRDLPAGQRRGRHRLVRELDPAPLLVERMDGRPLSGEKIRAWADAGVRTIWRYVGSGVRTPDLV